MKSSQTKRSKFQVRSLPHSLLEGVGMEKISSFNPLEVRNVALTHPQRSFSKGILLRQTKICSPNLNPAVSRTNPIITAERK